MSQDVTSLARALIDIPSVTGDEEEVGRHILGVLRALGFAEAELQPVNGNRYNVRAFPSDTRVVLCTHMDTVGPVEPSNVADGRLYGRGSVDAKGILASMIVAAHTLRGQDERRVGLLFLVGEEADSIGAQVANRDSPGPDYVVIGEPTEGKLATAQKGGLSARLQARGVAGHSGYPEFGASAIHLLLDALNDLRARRWGEDAVLGSATVNIGGIEGGVGANVLAPTASAEILIRLVGPASEARERFEEWASKFPEIEVRGLKTTEALRFHTLPGFRSGPMAFGSDAPYLSRFGTPLMFGPGSIRQAHTAGEFIDLDALRGAPAAYQRIVRSLLESGPVADA